MNNKSEMLALLQDEFNHWETLLSSLSQAQITAPNFIGAWSIKDVLAHLMTWQTRSIARLEAAQLDQAPEFPHWPEDLDPDFLESPDQINAWIYQRYHEEPWPEVHQNWQVGFQRFLELARAIPENDLLDPQKYAWMGGQPLMTVLQSSYEHHQVEHLEPLLALLG